MRMYFYSLLWSYLPRIPTILTTCVFTWNWGQSVGIPGPCEFFHQCKSSCSLMDIRVLWSSLYTAFMLTQREKERTWMICSLRVYWNGQKLRFDQYSNNSSHTPHCWWHPSVCRWTGKPVWGSLSSFSPPLAIGQRLTPFPPCSVGA